MCKKTAETLLKLRFYKKKQTNSLFQDESRNKIIFKRIGVARIFDWGGGPKSSKIRLSSPKLRVIFQPKSEIRTIFPPKIR